MSTREKILAVIQVIFALTVVVFSYGYVDLNLTLSSNPTILSIIKNLQFLAYYQRPLATTAYTIFLLVWFGLFVLLIYWFFKNKLSLKFLKLSMLSSVAVLLFAYPYLSSDLFNYMFDAKIIATYHQNPYTTRPMDIQGDDWLRFMRWVHRYSPYGPLWLLYSLVPTIVGLGKFVLTLFAFKLAIGLFQLINTWLVYKILVRVNSKKALLGAAIYGLNPLFLIEGVANAHNDVVIATCFLATIYFAVEQKKILSFASLAGGVFIKYIPILIFPWLLLYNRRPANNFNKLVIASFVTMALFTFIYSSFKITVPFVSSGSTQVQFQPWYLFWSLPFLALLPNFFTFTIILAVSFFSSLRYLPYLYYGDWSQPGTLQYLKIVVAVGLIFVIIISTIKYGQKFLKKSF